MAFYELNLLDIDFNWYCIYKQEKKQNTKIHELNSAYREYDHSDMVKT